MKCHGGGVNLGVGTAHFEAKVYNYVRHSQDAFRGGVVFPLHT
jgi:hypothetical protein